MVQSELIDGYRVLDTLTFELLQRDVFLIFSNAMYFNSTSTIYYRQVRFYCRCSFLQKIVLRTFAFFIEVAIVTEKMLAAF